MSINYKTTKKFKRTTGMKNDTLANDWQFNHQEKEVEANRYHRREYFHWVCLIFYLNLCRYSIYVCGVESLGYVDFILRWVSFWLKLLTCEKYSKMKTIISNLSCKITWYWKLQHTFTTRTGRKCFLLIAFTQWMILILKVDLKNICFCRCSYKLDATDCF